MILHDHLVSNGICLDKKGEALLGMRVSDFYRQKFGSSPLKISLPEFDGKVNTYPDEFLAECSETIIQFLTEMQETVNG
jgi:hypothetical protein